MILHNRQAFPKWMNYQWFCQSRPGRDLAPKTSQYDPRIELYRFLKDFGPILDWLFMIFSWFSTCFCIILCVFLNKSALSFFVSFSKTQILNHKNLQTISLNPWPGGMRVSDPPPLASARSRACEIAPTIPQISCNNFLMPSSFCRFLHNPEGF